MQTDPCPGKQLAFARFNPGLRSLPAVVAVMAVVGMMGLMGAALTYGVPTNIKVSELLPTLLDILKYPMRRVPLSPFHRCGNGMSFRT